MTDPLTVDPNKAAATTAPVDSPTTENHDAQSSQPAPGGVADAATTLSAAAPTDTAAQEESTETSWLVESKDLTQTKQREFNPNDFNESNKKHFNFLFNNFHVVNGKVACKSTLTMSSTPCFTLSEDGTTIEKDNRRLATDGYSKLQAQEALDVGNSMLTKMKELDAKRQKALELLQAGAPQLAPAPGEGSKPAPTAPNQGENETPPEEGSSFFSYIAYPFVLIAKCFASIGSFLWNCLTCNYGDEEASNE